MTSRFCTLTPKFFSSEVMTSWKFRAIENPAVYCTLCSEKNTHCWRFLLYVHGKCLYLHFYKIFRVCLGGIRQVIATADSQTFDQMFIFYRGTPYLQSREHDVRHNYSNMQQVLQHFHILLQPSLAFCCNLQLAANAACAPPFHCKFYVLLQLLVACCNLFLSFKFYRSCDRGLKERSQVK